MKEDVELMMIEQYPVGWAISAEGSVTAFLIDLPGVAMQGRNFAEAVQKLAAIAPSVLAVHRKEGRLKPPSLAPAEIAAVEWQFAAPRATDATDPIQRGPLWQLAKA
jgi:hypothetical protein